jgi:hypothetical protein
LVIEDERQRSRSGLGEEHDAAGRLGVAKGRGSHKPQATDAEVGGRSIARIFHAIPNCLAKSRLPMKNPG